MKRRQFLGLAAGAVLLAAPVEAIAAKPPKTLNIQDARHVHTADNVALGIVGTTLIIQDGRHAHLADTVVLSGQAGAKVFVFRRTGGGRTLRSGFTLRGAA